MAHKKLVAVFCKESFIETQSCSFTYVLPVAAFILQWQSSVVLIKTGCASKPRILATSVIMYFQLYKTTKTFILMCIPINVN